MKSMILGVLITSVAVPALAQTPAALRKAEQACAQQIIRSMSAPAEAKLLEHTKKHHKNQYTVCYQARTPQGGFAFVFGVCDYDQDGSLTKPVRVIDGANTVRSDVNLSNDFCRGAR